MKTHDELVSRFEAICGRHSYRKIAPANLLRSPNEQPYFVFSPLLNVVDALINGVDHERCFVTQPCLRSRERYKYEFSPLGTHFQKLFSVFDIIPAPHSHIVETVSELIRSLHLNGERLCWLIPDDNAGFAAAVRREGWRNVWPTNMESSRCLIPGLMGSSHYVRIVYQYGNGMVPIANLVLINADDACASLDSVFFTDRLTFILEGRESVLDTYLYKGLMDLINDIGGFSPREKRATPQILRAAGALVHAGLTPGPKKASHILRKLIRDVLTGFMTLNLTVTDDLLCAFATRTAQCLMIYDAQFAEISAEQFHRWLRSEHQLFAQNYSEHMPVAMEKISHLLVQKCVTLEALRDLSSTYGIPVDILLKSVNETGLVTVADQAVVEYSTKPQQYPFAEHAAMTLAPYSWYRRTPYQIRDGRWRGAPEELDHREGTT